MSIDSFIQSELGSLATVDRGKDCVSRLKGAWDEMELMENGDIVWEMVRLIKEELLINLQDHDERIQAELVLNRLALKRGRELQNLSS